MAKSKATTEEVQLVTADSNASHKKPVSPRTVVLQRVSNSYGFTLRHFVVYPPEAIKSRSLSENRTVNGIESDHEPTRGQPIDTVFVRQVSPGGPADKAGLSSGDQVVSVNGIQVLNKSYRQVIDLIQKSHDNVELGIVPKEECVLQMVSPIMSVSAPMKSPPPTKPKPTRIESSSSTPTIMSTMTIAPTHPSLDNASLTVTICDPPDKVPTVVTRRESVDRNAQHSPDKVPTVVTRRESVDRNAQENRAYVVSSKCDDVNNNLDKNYNSQKTTLASHEGGTYFFAATDYTGKPKALHFQRGTTSNANLDTLQVVDDSKGRSKSLPCVEMEGYFSWQEGLHQGRHQQNGPQISINENSLEINISQPEDSASRVLSSSRVVASDSPSTMNVSTNSEFMSRQPVAREPQKRPSVEEPASYLIRTISSHMNRERAGLQSSTIGATLLESLPNENVNNISSGSRGDEAFEPCQPTAKIPRQSNQVSVFPNQTKSEEIQLSISNEAADLFTVSRNQSAIEESRTSGTSDTSPRQRRTSYLMATANTSTSGSKPVGGSVIKATPTLSSALSSTFMTPMMVHVSSGTEICKDTPKEDVLMDDDEIFVDSEAGIDETHVPRVGRRTSYLMATASSTAPRVTLEGMKEEDEQPGEAVPGLLEIVKEGFLWKKLVVGGGGKRSSVRSWKAVYVVLRGHILYFHKDRDSAHQTKTGDAGDDQQPMSIKSSIVDIAHDYTKRKNVFRLTTFNGCEYLFQCEDRSSMMKWIEAIQSNNNPDEDESGVTSQSLIIRRMRNVEQESTGTSHSSGHKLAPTPSSAKMPNFSNLKKSLSFKNISGTQSKDEGSKTNKWHKSSKKHKKPSNLVNFVQGFSIGVPLEMCPMSKVLKCIPMLMEHCCEVIDTKGIDCIGIYRVPGNSAAVSLLQDEVNSKGAENVNFEEEKWHDINNITSLLKQFLRKLPEGLLTAELYESFIEANRKEDPLERMEALKNLINELPENSYETLKFLLAHLKRISDNKDANKMEARNLAIVFGPTLVRTGEDTMISMVKDMSDQCRIVETLLINNEWFFDESGEGDEPPIQPPIITEGQAHFVSMSMLSSLGQAAGNFGEDGNIKTKSGGLAHISLHIPKFRGKNKSESHDSSSPDGITSDESVSPTFDRGPPRVTTTGSCPGSPTQERRKLAPKTTTDLTSLSTGSMSLPIVAMGDDSKVRGASSLKAYSYARPPPPSYRKVGPLRSPVSPSSEHPLEAMPVCVTCGPTTPESEVAPKFEHEGTHDPCKPTFASLSEETRLRLLKVSLHQKAMEKKRQSENSSPVLSPPPLPQVDTSEESPTNEPHPPKSTDHEVFGSNEHLSSSNTSRSSSTPSSKTASLDSLHQPQSDSTEGRKGSGVYPTRVTASGGWKASLTPPHPTTTQTTHPTTTQTTHATTTQTTHATTTQTTHATTTQTTHATTTQTTHATTTQTTHATTTQTTHATTSQTAQPVENENNSLQSSQTVLTVVQGKGVKISGGEAKRRPASSDIRARRNTAEGFRVRPPMQSESSESSSEEEASELQLNMSKTFDEKLRILLDIDNSYKHDGQKKVNNEEDSSSLSSERSRRTSFDRNRLSSDDHVMDDHHSSTASLPTPASERRPSIENKQSERRRVSVDGTETRTSIQIESKPRKTASIARVVSSQTSPRSPDRRSSSETTKTVINVDATRRNSNPAMGKPPVQSNLGRVRTTTPVALKEFKIASATFRKDLGRSTGNTRTPTGHQPRVPIHKDSPIVKPKTEESSFTITPSPRNSYGSPRSSIADASPRSSLTESPRNSRSEVSINLSRTPKPSATAERKPTGKYAAMAARGHVQPKVMGRETTSKSKTLTNPTRRDILPSRGRHGGSYKEPGREKHAHKLETNAQHIADLLEEMHSERYLKMMRQRSDISGQAQKAAAQRAASRRRRRSLGDENEPNKEIGVKDSGETKESLIEATNNVSRYKRPDEQIEGKSRASNHKTLLSHPGNTKSVRGRRK